MRRITTIRTLATCPACGREQPLPVAVARLPGDEGPLADGIHEGRVPECPPCWSRRADALGRARKRLEVSGVLTSGQPCGQAAWPAGDAPGPPDVVAALEAELARQGVAGPAAARVLLLLCDGRAAVADEVEALPRA